MIGHPITKLSLAEIRMVHGGHGSSGHSYGIFCHEDELTMSDFGRFDEVLTSKNLGPCVRYQFRHAVLQV